MRKSANSYISGCASLKSMAPNRPGPPVFRIFQKASAPPKYFRSTCCEYRGSHRQRAGIESFTPEGSMKSNYLKTAAFLALTAVIGIATSQSALGQTQQNDQGLVGTWLFQVSIQDCNTGVPVGQPFLSLLTFAQGGTMTETTANPMFFPA